MATRLFDGNVLVEIEMRLYNGDYLPDFSNDFFSVGGQEICPSINAYFVKDVDYCIEQARDWELMRGDYCDDTEIPGYTRDLTYSKKEAYYTACKESGTLIERFWSYEDAAAAIDRYIESDLADWNEKSDDFYDIVDYNHRHIEQ